MKVVEKILTCSSLYDGYNGPEEIDHIVADDINNDWYIISIDKFVRSSRRSLEPEIIAIITLRKESI